MEVLVVVLRNQTFFNMRISSQYVSPYPILTMSAYHSIPLALIIFQVKSSTLSGVKMLTKNESVSNGFTNVVVKYFRLTGFSFAQVIHVGSVYVTITVILVTVMLELPL